MSEKEVVKEGKKKKGERKENAIALLLLSTSNTLSSCLAKGGREKESQRGEEGEKIGASLYISEMKGRTRKKGREETLLFTPLEKEEEEQKKRGRWELGRAFFPLSIKRGLRTRKEEDFYHLFIFFLKEKTGREKGERPLYLSPTRRKRRKER